jgi:2,3-bisphosphoglycerate-independent phosphoglycerate mutase
MPRVLFVFVDGIGLGRPGAQNPFDGAPVSILACLSQGPHDLPPAPGLMSGRLDATLGYPGLPQSATGQAVIFTGEDAMRVARGHRSGYPSRAVAELITERSALRRARDAGLSAGFLNAFEPERALRLSRIVRGEEEAPRHRAPSASALAALAGGGELRTFEDARRGRAATFDLTGEVLRSFGLDAPEVSLEESARAIARGAAELDLALFEMFLTDKAGHAQDMTWARHEIVRTERFLAALFEAVDPKQQLVIVSSDHGNLEDLSTRSHTRADVPLLAYGMGAQAFVEGARSILDVTPRLLSAAASSPSDLPIFLFNPSVDSLRP